MKKVSYAVVLVLLIFVGVATAGATPDNGAATQGQVIQPQTTIDGEQIVPPKAGISWKEKVMMQREIKKRAAASRNALMRQAAMEKQKESKKPTQQESPMEP